MGYPSYILANVIDNNEMERGWREMSPACPRCGSSNTKFCYYNNYSLTQPRYFCKGCRRYWTKGGSLRNVPVGGGCRKSRRSRSSTLRLTTTTPPSNHNLGVITSRNATMHGGHHHHNHHEHGGAHGSLVNDVGDSGTSSEAPAIDLASVYANFLNQKPQTNNPPQVDISSIPDATTIAPTFNVDCSSNTSNNNNNINDPLSFSQKLPTIPELIMNNNNNNNNNHDDIDHHHHNNQVLFVTEFSTPMMIHHDHHRHQHHNEDASSIQHNDELGLPPLPGGDSFMSHHHHQQQQQPLTWVASDLDHDHDHHQQHYHHHHHRNDVDNNSMQVLQDLETDSQFSNLFNNAGSWSPLNFPGFETSFSSSKP